MATLARRLGVFDAVLIVMGSVIGSGIFRTPSVVAQRAHEPWLILAAWVAGGVITLFSAFVFGELASRQPDGAGAYAYLYEAFHPLVGFAYGWTSLLVGLSGGIAAAAVLFAGYFQPLTGINAFPPLLAVAAIGILTLINCLGVRQGGTAQNIFMLLKIMAIGAIVAAGFFVHAPSTAHIATASHSRFDILAGLGIAMVPVLFAYNGATGANLVAAETRHAARTIPLGLMLGTCGIIILYVLVNAICVRALGAIGLANTATPASDVLRAAWGPVGERLIAAAIVLSTLGFISNRLLTAPRLYMAMAQDGLFFRQVAWIHPRTRVPIVAISLQAAVVIALALSGSYERILNYVVSTTYVFTGLLALAIFVLRARERRAGAKATPVFRVPWHPFSTILVLVASWGVALDTYISFPRDGLIGLAIILSSIPAYFLMKRSSVKPTAA